jgi:hypothetical protein
MAASGRRGAAARPPGLEARERLEAIWEARRRVDDADGRLKAATATWDADPGPAFAAGVDLARRRLLRAQSRLEDAMKDVAAGRHAVGEPGVG